MSEDAIDQMIYDGLFDEAVAARLERLAAEIRRKVDIIIAERNEQ